MIGKLFGVFWILKCCLFGPVYVNAEPAGMANATLDVLAEKARVYYPSKLDSTVFYAKKLISEIRREGIVSSYEEEMLDLLGLAYRRMGETELSKKYFLESISLSLKRNNIAQLGNSYNRLGLLYRGLGRFEEALHSYQQSIAYKEQTSDKGSLASTLNNLGNLYRVMGRREQAYQTFMESIAIRISIGDEKNAAATYMNLGNWMAGEAEYEQALDLYNTYKEIMEDKQDTLALAWVHSNIGNVYNELADYETALIYYLESEALFKHSNIKDDLEAYILQNIGVIFSKTGYPRQAIGYSKKAAQLYARFGSSEGEGSAYQNIGQAFELLEQPDSALFYYQKALQLMESIGIQLQKAEILQNIGVIHNQNADYVSGLGYLLQAKQILEENPTDRLLARLYNNIGSNYFYLNDLEQALEYYGKSLEKATETYFLEVQLQAAFGLAETYGKIGQYKQAYLHQLKYDAYKDSLMNLERIKAVEELITKYETEKVEAENELLLAKSAQNEALIQQRNAENKALFFGIVTLIVIMLSIIGWGVYNNRKKRIIAAQKEVLYQNKIDVLLNRQQLESVSAMLEGQQKERKRLAAELHDRLGSILSLVKLYFSSMHDSIKQTQPELYASFAEGNQFLDDVFTEVRALIREMKEGTGSGEGLKKDIELLLEKINRLGINIQCRMELQKKLDAVVEMNVYRIIQEALSNSLKYSKAETIELMLSDSVTNCVSPLEIMA